MTDIQQIEYWLHAYGRQTREELWQNIGFAGKRYSYLNAVLDGLVQEGLVLTQDYHFFLNMERYESFINALGGKRVRRKYHTEPHNKDYKLIRQWIATDDGYIHLIYGETNQGDNKGVEAYYYRDNGQGHHHYSRRWPLDKVPNHFRTDALCLQELIPYCPDGHKLYVP